MFCVYHSILKHNGPVCSLLSGWDKKVQPESRVLKLRHTNCTQSWWKLAYGNVLVKTRLWKRRPGGNSLVETITKIFRANMDVKWYSRMVGPALLTSETECSIYSFPA